MEGEIVHPVHDLGVRVFLPPGRFEVAGGDEAQVVLQLRLVGVVVRDHRIEEELVAILHQPAVEQHPGVEHEVVAGERGLLEEPQEREPDPQLVGAAPPGAAVHPPHRDHGDDFLAVDHRPEPDAPNVGDRRLDPVGLKVAGDARARGPEPSARAASTSG